jgi:chitinase
VADAGADISVTHLTNVTLDGSASHAGDGSALTYAWTQLSGTAVELTGADTANPTFRAPPQPETPNVKRVPLTFQLVVTDRFGMQATSTVTVDVKPGKPGG